MLGDPPVVVRVHLIKNNKDHVKTGEEGVLHANVVHWGLVLIILERKRPHIRRGSSTVHVNFIL